VRLSSETCGCMIDEKLVVNATETAIYVLKLSGSVYLSEVRVNSFAVDSTIVHHVTVSPVNDASFAWIVVWQNYSSRPNIKYQL
jgi:hypothetical protein